MIHSNISNINNITTTNITNNNTTNNSIMNKSSIDALAEAAMKRGLDSSSCYTTSTPASLSPSLLGTADLKLSPSSSSDPNLMAAFSARRVSMPAITPTGSHLSLPNVAGSNDHALYLSILNDQRRRSMTDLNFNSRAGSMTSPSTMSPNQAPVGAYNNQAPNEPPAPSSANYASMMQSQFDSTVTAPSRRRKPNFAEKLHSVLSSKDCRRAIAWLPSGRSFCITDQEEFVKNILPKFFREAKFESFSRRLKRWGFRKVYTTGLSQIIFSHDLFHRDRPDLCKIMNGREKVGAADDKPPVVGSDTGAPSQYGTGQFSNVMMFQQAQQQAQQQFQHQQHHMAMQQQMNQQRASMFSMPQQGQFPPPTSTSPSGAMSLQNSLHSLSHQNHMALRGASTSPDDLKTQAMITQAQAIVARSMLSQDAAQVDPEDPSTIHQAKMQLGRLNDDIANCEEQLVILQQLKDLKEKRRMLTGSTSPRGVSPSST